MIRIFPCVQKEQWLPCKIGDTAWCIRNFRGTEYPKKGEVSDIYFVCVDSGMELHIVVKGVGRGEWGEKVFPTEEAAQRAIDRKKNPENTGLRKCLFRRHFLKGKGN